MRNISLNALILSIHPQGENNRVATIFSETDGIIYATLYGGPKSKLRSLVSPMNSGILYLYRDESKKSTKITDFDVKKYHLSFRENLFKTYASAFAAEILIKTKCAGSPKSAWRITNGLLDGMELSDEKESRLGFVRFLWRYLEILGIKPNTSTCVQCGESLHSRKFSKDSLLYTNIFDERENGFICADCSHSMYSAQGGNDSHKSRFILGKSALTYLEAISTLAPKDVRRILIDEKSYLEMKELCFALIENACGSKLKSLESGIGIL